MINFLVCLLEEPSAKEMLEGILPRFIDDGITVKYIVFEGRFRKKYRETLEILETA